MLLKRNNIFGDLRYDREIQRICQFRIQAQFWALPASNRALLKTVNFRRFFRITGLRLHFSNFRSQFRSI